MEIVHILLGCEIKGVGTGNTEKIVWCLRALAIFLFVLLLAMWSCHCLQVEWNFRDFLRVFTFISETLLPEALRN